MAFKILWLCSWYPNDIHPFDGDFIQRHAEAVSEGQAIDVLYVHKYEGVESLPTYQKTIRSKNLTEHVFMNHVKAKHLFSQLIGWINYFLIHLRFIKKNGRPDLIHVHIPMKSGIIALYYKWRYNIPYVVTEHYGIYNFNLNDHFKTRDFSFRFLTKLIMKHADVLTTVSKSLGDDINHWVLKKEFVVIPNVVDTRIFYFSERVAIPTFQFIHISNMIPLKNIQGIIEATEQLWQERNDFSVKFVGRIAEEYYQLAKSKKLLDAVIFFEGEVPYMQVASFIKESDGLIIFSDTESQSCVVLEALCCGRPVIVTNVGGVKELVNDSNGYKINPRDTEDLVNKMRDMIKNYASFDTKNISVNAIASYSYSHVERLFQNVYSKILDRH